MPCFSSAHIRVGLLILVLVPFGSVCRAQNQVQEQPSGTHTQAISLYRTIASLRGVNASGVADSVNKLVVITGTVHTINYRPTGLEFGISDFSGGMHIFKSTNLNQSYTVLPGDSIRVRGTVNQFRGLTQISPDSISILQTNRDVKTPELVAQPSELTEGKLMRIEDLILTPNSVWGGASSYTAKALKGTNTTDTIYIRIDTDALISYPRPTGRFNLIGHGTQFTSTTSAPFAGGYQIYPRSNFDFSLPFQTGVVYAYVANKGSHNLSVINTTTNTVSATIPVGNGPGKVAVSGDGSRIYTANQGSSTVSVVNAANQSVIAQIQIPHGVPGSLFVSPDRSKVYVSSFNPDYITVINTQTNTITQSVQIGGEPGPIVVSPDGTKLFVAQGSTGKIAVLNAANLSALGEITIGTRCLGMAINPAGTKLYATKSGTNQVAIINPTTYNVTTLALFSSASPNGVNVSPNGLFVYVSNLGTNTITKISGITNEILISMQPTQSQGPEGICVHPDGTKVYVANAGSNIVSVVNTSTNQTMATIPVGNLPYSGGNMLPFFYPEPCPTVVFSPDTLPDATSGVPYNATISQTGLINPVFTLTSGTLPNGITMNANGLLSGTTSGATVYPFTIQATSGLCSATRNYTITTTIHNAVLAYVPCSESDSVAVINSRNYTVLRHIAVGDHPVGVSVSPNRTRVYIANQNSDNVSVINSATNTVIATVPVGDAPSHIMVSPDGSKVFVLNTLGSSVSVINTGSNTVSATIATLPNPTGIAIVPDGSKLYVSHPDDDKISVINTLTNTVTTTITSVGKPKGLAIDRLGTRLFVANFQANNVRVFDLSNHALVFTTAVGNGPVSVAVNPDGSDFYVANSISKTVSLVKSTGVLDGTVIVSNSPQGISIAPEGHRVFVAISDAVNGKVGVIPLVTTPYVVTYISIKKAPIAFGNMMPMAFGPCPNITISPASLPNGQEGVPYNATLTQTGLDYPVFYASSGWPSGMYILPTGQIMGTPTESGNFNLNVMVTAGTCSKNITYPITIGINANALYAYVPNSGSGVVSVINAGSETVSNTISSNLNPAVVAVNVDGSRAYVCGFSQNKVEVINGTTFTVSATITVGNGPTGLVLNPNGTRLYVLCKTSKTIHVVNTQTNAVAAIIPISGTPAAIDMARDGSRIFVADNVKNKIRIINTATNSEVDSINVFPEPEDVLIDRSGKRLYVHCYNTPKIYVYDLLSKAYMGEIPLPQQAFSMVFNPAGDQIYVSVYQDKIVVINPIQMTVVDTISGFGNGYGISFTPDGAKAIVAMNQLPNGKIGFLNTTTLTQTSTHELGSGILAVGNMMPLNYSPCSVVNMTPANGILPVGNKNQVYSGSISQTGFTTPSFFVSSGSLPTGLVLNSSGNLSGTPTVSGTFSFVITVYQGGCVETKLFSLTINCPGVSAPVIAGTNTICTGSSTTLSVSNPQANTTYLWSNGSTGNSISVNAAGSFSVQAISNGCTSAVSLVATVSLTPLPQTPGIAGNTSFCVGGNTTLSISNPQANTTYLWSNGSTGNSILVNTAGSFSVRAISNGCTSAVSQVSNVSLTPLPQAPGIAGNLSFCAGGNTTLSISNPQANTTYMWSNGPTGNSIVVNGAGSFSVQAISNGCTSAVSAPSNVSVNPLPATPEISISGNNTCQVSLSATGGTSYLWYLENVLQMASSATYQAAASGVYTVASISTLGCTSAVSLPAPVTVSGPLPSPTITGSGSNILCQGDSVILSASGPSGAVFTWSNGVVGENLVVKTAGIYSATYLHLGCNSLISNAISVFVNPLPIAFITQFGNDLLVGAIPGASYHWLLNGTEVATTTTPIYTPLVSGNYSVRVVDTGCSSVSEEIFFQFVSVRPLVLSGVKMYPNPGAGMVWVESSGPEPVEIQVTDQLGRRILEIPKFEGKIRFDLPSGLYFVTIKNGESTEIKKLVVN